MVKLKIAVLCLATMLLFVGVNANASVVFFDNFNTENGGNSLLNYSGFANWTVSDGSVDLIGNKTFDFYPGNGLYVDMDGTTGNASKMTTSQSFAAGNYLLEFDLGGSTRGGTDSVGVALNVGTYSETISLASTTPLTHYSRLVTTTAAGSLVFEGFGGDNVGLILDNVKLTAVPEPAFFQLAALLGLGGFGLKRLRAYRKVR